MITEMWENRCLYLILVEGRLIIVSSENNITIFTEISNVHVPVNILDSFSVTGGIHPLEIEAAF